MAFERDFSTKVLEQNTIVNENIEVKYFEIDINSDDGVLEDYEAIEQQVGIWFNTKIGERYFNDPFGNPLIELVHRSILSISKDDLDNFYNKLEFDVEIVKVDRDTAEVYFKDDIMFVNIKLFVAGISQNITINQEISI